MRDPSSLPWAKVIRFFGKRPSLPLLIGALLEFTDYFNSVDDGLTQVTMLIQEMAESQFPDGNVVCLDYCRQIHVPVFCIDHAPSSIYGEFVRMHGADDRNYTLFVSTKIEKSPDTSLSELADMLYHGYGHPDALELRQYSRGEGEWRALDRDDIHKLRSAIGR